MTTVTRYTDQYYSYPGDGYDGVGMVYTGSKLGTGALLFNGRAVLTAAHVLEGSRQTVEVAFDTPEGRTWVPVERYWVHSGYDSRSASNDLAILWLDHEAPLSLPRYDLYTDRNEIGQIATLVGYGATGLGIEGYTGEAGLHRTIVQNRFETTWDVFNKVLDGIGWQTPEGSQLIADFDNGSSQYDSLGRLLGLHDTGLGGREGSIAPGDSGGPAFIDGKLAGIASYSTSLNLANGESLDITDSIDGSFGEVAAWQRVSFYQSWIEDVLSQAQGGVIETGDPVTIYGEAGSNLLIAGDGDTILMGQNSNDRLRSGFGDDRLDGGGGMDVARIDVPFDAVRVVSRPGETLTVESAMGRDELVNIALVRLEDRVVPIYATDIRTFGQNMVFDQKAYLMAYSDVADAGIDPLEHYLQWGASEGRSPSALFDEQWYLAVNADVGQAVQRGDLASGYEHYAQWGGSEGRNPSPWMDTQAYLKSNPDVAAAGVEPLAHYLSWGAQEGRVIVAADDGLWG